MLDNLLNLVKEHAGNAIINNPVIPNEKNDEAISTATNGIMDTLKSQISAGGLDSITSLFGSNNAGTNPLVGQISDNVGGQLMQKFGLDEYAAGSIVQQLVPVVMSKLVSKTNDPNDSSFNMEGILSSIGGGNIGGILDSVKGMFGK
jgi:hypothetical protein